MSDSKVLSFGNTVSFVFGVLFGAGFLITSAKSTEHLKGFSQEDEFKASVFCIENGSELNWRKSGEYYCKNDMKISKSEISGGE